MNPSSSDPIPEVLLGKRRIARDEPVFIIAEVGTSHMGDLSRARELIDAAAESGADCVKFQWVIADEIVHPGAGSIQLPGGSIAIWERFRQLERPVAFYSRLKEYTEQRGLVFLCSPFGPESARRLLELNISAVKIASPELNYYPLLQIVSGLPLILSTGVSEMEDIDRCVAFLKNGVVPGSINTAAAAANHPEAFMPEPAGAVGDLPRAVLLHCITAYPAPEEEYNLRILPLLAKKFRLPVGTSDHSADPIIVPLLSLAEGASMIEKHFTLSRNNPGLDDPIALEPGDFSSMCRHLRESETEDGPVVLDECRRLFGHSRVDAVLGTGEKVLAPSEAKFYQTTKRSVVALHALKPGDIISAHNTALLRCEQNRSAGVPPHQWESILGMVVNKQIPAGEGIQRDKLR